MGLNEIVRNRMKKIAKYTKNFVKNKPVFWLMSGVVVLFAGTGLYLTLRSSAATYVATAEAESGSITGNAQQASGAGASGNSYIVFGTAPSGQAITYGSSGSGNPRTDDCTVKTTPQNMSSAISGASSGAVICVSAGDAAGSGLTVNKAVTVRANGNVKIKSASVSGGGTLDGFSIVGPVSQGIAYSGDNNKILNNVITGRGITIGIFCSNCGNGTLVANNTVTNITNYGMRLQGGSNMIVEKNNIYDLWKTGSDDVDALRIWGTNNIVRFNYFHDINEHKSSGGAPHVDCIQNYDSGGSSNGLLIENNYCLRVTRQCFISQNLSSGYKITNITYRGNVCETFDSQTINIGSMNNITFENNLIMGGVKYQVVCMENRSSATTGVKFRNNILIKGVSSAQYYACPGAGGLADDTNNIKVLETFVKDDENAHRASREAYPARVDSDFTRFRQLVQKYDIIDKGAPSLKTGHTKDIDGGPRVKGAAMDIGPFEIR